MVFSTFILRYVESKFTLLTYLMENNTVITVISYCTKGLNNSKTKQKPIPTTHNKSIKSRELIFCGVLFCGFFSAGTNFADRGRSAKFAKIRTRKIFMLQGMYFKHDLKRKHHRLHLHTSTRRIPLGKPANIKVENNGGVVYVGSSLTVHRLVFCSQIVTE